MWCLKGNDLFKSRSIPIDWLIYSNGMHYNIQRILKCRTFEQFKLQDSKEVNETDNGGAGNSTESLVNLAAENSCLVEGG